MSVINYSVIFNGTDLTSVSGLTVLATDPYTIPKRKLTIGELAQSNKSKVSSGFYTEKNITVKVIVSRATRALLEQSIDSLMGLLQGLEKELILVQSNNSRKYICTLADVVEGMSGGSSATMDIVFACSDRFGYDLAPTLIINNIGGTGATRNDQYDFTGSADTQCPVWTITLTALTGGTLKDVVIGNGATGQLLIINRTWVAGDLLEVDGYNNTVKVNGVEVDFTGTIPYFAPGVGYITYRDDLTTRTLSYKVTYVKRWV